MCVCVCVCVFFANTQCNSHVILLAGCIYKYIQICPFKGTAPGTSCCAQKGTIVYPYFSVCIYIYIYLKKNLYIYIYIYIKQKKISIYIYKKKSIYIYI